MSLSWAWPYERAGNCASGPADGARHLLAWLLEEYPLGWSGGIFNCRNVRGGTPKSKSTHGEGRAVDFMLPVVDGRGHPTGHTIVAHLGTAGARLGIQFVIFDRLQWSAKNSGGGYYGGAHPHRDHLHIELTRAAARNLTLATLRSVLGGQTAPQQEDDMIERDDRGDSVTRLQWRINQYLHGESDPRGNGKPHGLVVDGVFGENTEAYVHEVQRRLKDTKYPGKVSAALLLQLHELTFKHEVRA